MQFRGVTIPSNLYQAGFISKGSPITLKTPIDFDKIDEVLNFINQWDKAQTFNKHITSYGLKHVVERDFDYRKINRYVSNGELIAAMLISGFKYRMLDKQNAIFNVSESSVQHTERKEVGFNDKMIQAFLKIKRAPL